MLLRDQINSDLKTALKSSDALRLSVLRMLTAAFKNKEIENRTQGNPPALSDDDIQSLLRTELKKRKEAIQIYEQAGRTELAQKEKEELAVIDSYLPKQLPESEVRNLVEKIFAETSPKNIGEAMKAVMAELKGRADGALINRLVQEKLK
jgi:uncharacterized protein